MIALYILAAIAAAFIALLLCSVTLTLDYDKSFEASVGFLGFKINLTDKKQKPKREKTKERPKEPKPENPLITRFKSNSVSQNVREGAEILRSVLPVIKNLLSHIRVRQLDFSMRVADFDAAKTAMEYGAVCTAVYNLLSWLDSFLDLSAKRVDIIAAFSEEKSTVRLHVKLKLRVIIMLCAAYKLFLIYKNLTEEKINERQEHSVNN